MTGRRAARGAPAGTRGASSHAHTIGAELVADRLGELAVGARLERALVVGERPGARREATLVDPHLDDEVVAGLAGGRVLLGGDHRDEDGHPSSSGSASRSASHVRRAPVGDGEEAAEEPDRHEHEEQLVPTALVG